ncbi:MAG: hypothetical protein WED05_12575 [Candidatus Atabeyarchaeum deiterrae]
MFIIRPCSTKAAFEAVLKRQVRINLTESSKELESKGYELIAVTDYVMVVKRDYEFTVFPSGRVLIKDIEDMNVAKSLIEKLLEDLGLYES